MGRPGRRKRPRGTLVYTKQALSLEDLTNKLEERGLAIPDRDRAVRYLRHIGYFRLSPYAIPFQRDRVEHLFREGTVFDNLLDLYVFDRSLRLLVMDALERVEVAIRAAVTDHMATTYANPHWYVDPSHFKTAHTHRDFVAIIHRHVERRLEASPESDETLPDRLLYRSALEHYLLTYAEPELPPSWLMVEMLTIGQLESLIQNLGRRSDRTAIARAIGLNAELLESWLRTYVRVRNICAHHGRLWNVGLGVYPKIPADRTISWPRGAGALPNASLKRLYPVLVSLQSVLDVVSPRSSWAQRLHDLVSTRPPMNLRGMGIPADWASDEFWARRLR